MASNKANIAVAKGDGIGPEIMDAALNILKESGAKLDIHEVSIGETVYLKGLPTGIEPDTWDVLRNTEAFLKAPITTPQGGGFKSLNVTIRGAFSLYANIRPCISYYPVIENKHPGMDVVVIRENEEDLYTGIEYQNSEDVTEAIKIISRNGCERIIRYAFDYAVANSRKKVTCFTKDNILKITDGLFHNVFDEIAKEYPQIENEHWIIDIGAAKLADTPEQFDVVVMPNLYGDILSDIAAQIAGSVGLAGSANIGETLAMFEAIHGSAPRRAGQNLANPSGIILASIMMLNHLHQGETASLIQNAWLKTLEDGIHTYDIFKEEKSTKKVGTKEFGEAIIERLGKKPETLKPAKPQKPFTPKPARAIPHVKKELVGVDIFINWNQSVQDLQKLMDRLAGPDFSFTLCTNRGAKLWPDPMPETFTVDNWRCRFKANNKTVSQKAIIELQQRLAESNVDFVQTIHLHKFDGKLAYSQNEY